MPGPGDITVLIVDDDPVVTATLKAQVKRVDGFKVVGVAHTGHGALAAAQKFSPQLVLLDLHLPDLPGLEVAHRLRRPDRPPTDVIVISARRESAAVSAAIQRGALYYLVKPTKVGVVEETLVRYAATAERLAAQARFTEQQEIDQLFRALHTERGSRPPSISSETERRVIDALAASAEDLSALELAHSVGISRATARRYLEHLSERGQVEAHLRYGPKGRPQHRYRVR
ncbi:response regulator [Microtetraspora sp. NBRC 13810]|uniref:response regulator n=1 Tax=Microtetraspora sp. NBRC 13810 TaxID=3030990 RepID=UPI0025576F23|nr:response regulator [Microtetraspora sp. NBRC 13810]